MVTIQYDDSGWNAAFKEYLNLRRAIDPKKEIRRRAKNVAMRLIAAYKKAAPSVGEIGAKVASLNGRVRVRARIKAKGGSRKWQIGAERRARNSARMFTATGWFPAAEKLGGNPRSKVGGPRRGILIEKLSGANLSETLVNLQPGAEQTADRAGDAIQKALNAERDDMLKYIQQKQDGIARKAGL